MLQQYLPLAVLKLVISSKKNLPNRALQQYLPLAVLKRCYQETSFINCLGCYSAYRLPLTVLKRVDVAMVSRIPFNGCNSAYRLRYAMKGAR